MELLTEDVKNVVMTDTGFLMCFSYFTHLKQIFQLFKKRKVRTQECMKTRKTLELNNL